MNIFFAVNNDYTKYLSVAMASILYNLDKEQIINFFILDGGISDENKKKLNALKYIKNFNIEYIKVDKSKFENILEYHFKHITIDANYRLIMSSVKPDLDKCLYLDFDLVVDKDITELYSINIDSFYIGAVVDAVNQNNYINSGVMLVNLERWRKEDIEYKLFHNLIKYSSRLICPDQDIINITLRDRIKYLNPKYNAMPVQIYVRENEKKEAFYNPVIIHWAGDRKPWIYSDANYSEYFWKYARMSPFYEDIIYKNIFKRLNNIEYKIDKLIDTLAWWIPIRKWRDNFRNKFFDKFIGGG